MLNVSKAHAGSSSLGYTWDTDGAVVEVPDDVAAILVAIPDGGFAIVSESAIESEVAPETAQAITEPAPDEAPSVEAPAKTTRTRSTKASKEQ